MSTQPKIEYHEPTQEEIATYAYYLWEAEGRQSGRDSDYWLQAKAQLIANRQYEAGLFQSPGSDQARTVTVESPGTQTPAEPRRETTENKESAVPSSSRKRPTTARKAGPAEPRVAA